MPNAITTYEVNFTLTVDHPELRDATYPRVAPGTKVQYKETFTMQRDAKRFMQSLADGTNTMWICDSEHVTSCGGRAVTSTLTGERMRSFGGFRSIARGGSFEQVKGWR